MISIFIDEMIARKFKEFALLANGGIGVPGSHPQAHIINQYYNISVLFVCLTSV